MILLISESAYDNYDTNGTIETFPEEDFEYFMKTGFNELGVGYDELRDSVLRGEYEIYQVSKEIPLDEIRLKYFSNSS